MFFLNFLKILYLSYFGLKFLRVEKRKEVEKKKIFKLSREPEVEKFVQEATKKHQTSYLKEK